MSIPTAELPLLLGFIDIGPGEMILLGIVAVLLFGQRLPEVGRTIGKGMAEFKRGMLGLASDDPKSSAGGLPGLRSVNHDDVDDYIAPSGPKFELPATEPDVPEPEVTPQADATVKN